MAWGLRPMNFGTGGREETFPVCFPVIYALAIESSVVKSRADIFDILFSQEDTPFTYDDSYYSKMISGEKPLRKSVRYAFLSMKRQHIENRLEQLSLSNQVENARAIETLIRTGILEIGDECYESKLKSEFSHGVDEATCLAYLAAVLQIAVRSNREYVLTTQGKMILKYYRENYETYFQNHKAEIQEYTEIIMKQIEEDVYKRELMLLVTLCYYDDKHLDSLAETVQFLASSLEIEPVRHLGLHWIKDELNSMACAGLPVGENELNYSRKTGMIPDYIQFFGSREDIIAKLQKESEIQNAFLE